MIFLKEGMFQEPFWNQEANKTKKMQKKKETMTKKEKSNKVLEEGLVKNKRKAMKWKKEEQEKKEGFRKNILAAIDAENLYTEGHWPFWGVFQNNPPPKKKTQKEGSGEVGAPWGPLKPPK